MRRAANDEPIFVELLIARMSPTASPASSLSRAQGRLVQNAAAQGPAHPLSCRVSVSRADISAHDAPVSD